MGKQLNIFVDGILSDLDVSYIKNTQWLFPTHGFRFFNKDGKGFIASVLPSNEEIFAIRDNFGILGVSVYGDIAYIFSFNESSGISEIGCYPSPDPNNGGFIRQYHALRNFNHGDFTTPLLNFSWTHPIDCLIRLSYDNSVDLFFCDYNNPNRVVNSGFDIKNGALLNTRNYTDSSFEGSINQFPVSSHIPSAINAEVMDGGYLKPGNYYVYLQYVDVDYNTTTFMSEMGPFMVAQGDFAGLFMGLQEKDWLRDVQNQTNKKIHLELLNLDTNYKYVQVGIIRYTNAQENGPAYRDVYLVNSYFLIGGSSMTLEITGAEGEKVLTLEDVVNPVVEFDVCRSQIQLMNYWLGATWKKSDPIYDPFIFRDFAQRIVVGEKSDFTILYKQWPTIQNYNAWATMPLQTYQDSKMVLASIGFFKGQIYPFAVKLILKGGKETEAFPLQGKGDPDTDGIYKGLYRFNTWQETFNGSPYPVTQKVLTKVTFDCSSAINYMNANPAKFQDVIAIQFLRGPRVENLICQGVMMRGFWGLNVNNFDPASDGDHGFQNDLVYVGNIYNTGNDPSNAAIMPFYKGNVPTAHYRNITGTDYDYYSYANEDGHQQGVNDWVNYKALPDKNGFFDPATKDNWYRSHGLFSPDALFDKDIVIPPDVFVEPVFYFDNPDSLNDNVDNLVVPTIQSLDLNEDKHPYLRLCAAGSMMASACMVDKGQIKGQYNFTARLTDGGTGMGIDLYNGSVKNRDIGTCRYVGIVDNTPNKDMRWLYGKWVSPIMNPILTIVNLYRNANDDTFFNNIRESFDTRTCLYSPVGYPMSISMFHGLIDLIDYCGGDCFLQKSWFRTHRWYDMYSHANNANGLVKSIWGNEFRDNDGFFYQYGLMLGMVTENRINAEVRNEVVGQDSLLNYIRYTFYPHAMSYGLTLAQWIHFNPGNFAHEAIQVNAGYNKILSDKVTIGYDSTKVFYRVEEPNRVYPSGKDAYRSLLKGSYQDYAKEDGRITAIRLVLSHPYIVQEYAINQIFFAERMIQQTQDANDVIIGNSISILGDTIRKIADFGSQHKSSMITGEKGDYGFDYRRIVWWWVYPTTLQSGSSMLQCKDLISEGLVEKEFNDYITLISPNPDIISVPKDDPLNGYGIVGFFDPEFKEIGMTFLLTREDGSNIREDRTYIFDEKTGKFKGCYPFMEPIYFNLGQRLMSVQHKVSFPHLDPQHAPDNNTMAFTINNHVWRYNSRSGSYGTFFNIIQPCDVTIIINGLSKDQGVEKVYKMFTGMEIECKYLYLLNVIYETLYQKGTFDFMDQRPSVKPQYENHKWIFPVINQLSIKEGQFSPKSEMQGLWMKATIGFKGELDPEIRSIATNFDLIPEV